MKCGHPKDYCGYGILVACNDDRHVVEWCWACHSRATSNAIGTAEQERLGIDKDTLEVVQDNRTPDYPCERCGEIATEYHHWAPRYLFDDCEEWPTSYLCRSCHRRWHDTVTPNMSVPHWEGVELP